MSVTSFPSVSFAEIIGKRQIWNLPNPGAGNEWSFVFPGGYYYRLLGGSATFTTSATVANRLPGLMLSDGTNLLGLAHIVSNVTATSVVTLIYTTGGTWSAASVVGGTGVMTMLPIWIPPNYLFSSTTTNLQVGDAYTNLVLWFEQLEIGARGIPMGRHEPTLAEEEELYGVG